MVGVHGVAIESGMGGQRDNLLRDVAFGLGLQLTSTLVDFLIGCV